MAKTRSSGGPKSATITVPLVEELPPGATHRAHVDARLRGTHGAIMLRIRAALDSRGARTRDGKTVHTLPDALRWMIEQVEAEATA